ncbi:hypothetical protein [Streptomyces sp. NPDC055749]
MGNGRSRIGFDAAAGSNLKLLDPIVAHAVRETGASVAMVYPLPPAGTTLWPALLAGVPAPFATPWARVTESAPIPVADAVRERRLVWIGSQQERPTSGSGSSTSMPGLRGGRIEVTPA